MMPSPGLERTARLIAENVIAAVAREPAAAALHPLMRDALMVALLREILPAMPAGSGEALAAACNRCLDRLTDLHMAMPRVETVDLFDGAVTLRRAS